MFPSSRTLSEGAAQHTRSRASSNHPHRRPRHRSQLQRASHSSLPFPAFTQGGNTEVASGWARRRWALKRAEAAKAQGAATKSALKNVATKKAAVKAPPAKAANSRAPVRKAAARRTVVTDAARGFETYRNKTYLLRRGGSIPLQKFCLCLNINGPTERPAVPEHNETMRNKPDPTRHAIARDLRETLYHCGATGQKCQVGNR
jgi:hypothetical protein